MRVFGDSAAQEGAAIATDAKGNVYLTGYTNGSIDFGGGVQTESGGVIAAAFDATGTALWAETYGPQGQGLAIAAEPDGDVLVAGQVSGGVNFGLGGFVSGSAEYTFLASISQPSESSSKAKWNKFYGGDTSDSSAGVIGTALTLAPRVGSSLGDAVVVGLFTEPADFGTGTVGPTQSFPYSGGFAVRVAP
jgi:hypothetical protein